MDREGEAGEADKGEKVHQGESEGEKGESEEKSQEQEDTQSVPPAEKKKAPPAKSGKVEVRLQAAGDAPIMKQKNYKVRVCTWHVPAALVETICTHGSRLQQNPTDVVQVDGEKKISWIIQFIRKYLKLEQSDSLFLYVNQAFSPSPDQTVSNLNECFGSADNKLVLYYSRSECWG